MALQGVRQGVENRLGEEPFVGGDKAQVAAGELGKGPPGNRPDQRRQARRPEGVGQPRGVAFRTAVVRDDAGKAEIRLEGRRIPCTSAATLRPIPWTFATRRTGASSQRAISAVLPSSVAVSAPSKSPMTPSTRAQSASAAARSKRRQTCSFPAIQPSRL